MNGLEQFAANLLAELCERYPMGYVPRLEWRGFRVSAGLAYYRIGTIALSNRVLKTEAQIRDTLVHEYAHLLAVHRHGPRAAGHGQPWRQAMIDLGAEPKVRHTYEVERNQARQKVTYRCSLCGKAFLRGRRFPKRVRYLHVGCGGELRLESVRRVTTESLAS